MQKRLIQATATVMLFATMALPAFAHGNGNGNDKGNGHGGHGNGGHADHGWHGGEGHGQGLGLGLTGNLGLGVSAGSHHSISGNGQGDDEQGEGDRGNVVTPPLTPPSPSTIAACIAAAKTARTAALTLAQDTSKDATASARATYLAAVSAATQTKLSARLTARTAFLASDKGSAAWTTYLTARQQANAAWTAATQAARTAWSTAKTAAKTALSDAKAQANAAFQTAKAACSTTTPPPSTTDTAAPAAVSNLSLSGATTTSVILNWTAPGDDGSTGTATSYDVRYSTSAITDANFSAANAATGAPAPALAGTSQTMTVSGLAANTTYFFAMKTSDEVPNVSALSNVPSISTLATADTTAPSAVTNLSLSGVTSTSVTLNWIAPGDDATTGTATSYDARYSTAAITDANFASATQVTGEPVPTAAGTSQSMTLSGLSAGTTYFFAMKTSDEVPNVSALSNVPSTTTLAAADVTAPAAITDLSLSGVTSSAVILNWTAPGDDGSTGTATSYDVRYSTSAITDANFASATQVTGEPAPAAASTTQSMTVSGLSASTTYFFAVKTSDEVPNVSALSNLPSVETAP